MFQMIITSVRALAVFTVLCGMLYPLCMNSVSQTLFRKQATGSLVKADGTVAGSALIAQPFSSPGYFWPRPSASGFATEPSGASNQGFTNKNLQDAVAGRTQAWENVPVPSDLLLASGSGLDPHVSPEAAYFQVARVAESRNLGQILLKSIVEQCIEPPQWGVFGKPRVNVLLLNRTLDKMTLTRD